MSGENTEFEDGPAPDPFEAELVAYLDGELDAAGMRKVEARLANDPAARARAAELKKSFDLLDYLPKPEPSPNFTTRTLDKVPAIKSASGSAPQVIPPTPSRSGPKARPAPSASTSMPISLDDEDAPRPVPNGHGRSWSWVRVAGLCAALAVFGAVGYLATSAARSALFTARNREVDEARNDPDARVLEHLPLLAVADDLSFVQELAKPDLFGDEPAVAYDSSLKVPLTDLAAKPPEASTKAFRALPPARRAEIVKLDQDLYAKEPKERDRLFRALEAYAVWLDRLSDPDRRGVLHAATPTLRLGVIHGLREQQWVDALPPPLRKKWDGLNANEKAEHVRLWKEDEAARRDRRAFLRQHAEAFAANKSPWPFDAEATRKDVIEFARAAFRPDEQRRCRLNPEELAEYRRALVLAERDGVWVWYGLVVYELSKQHPYLPEPADPKQLITEQSQLPVAYALLVTKKGGGTRLKPATFGKWPDFPIEVLKEIPAPKAVGANLPPLGPAKLDAFTDPVREFATKELFPKLTADEKSALQRLEGKWPEYPREFVKYATKYDLAVPGVTLPGSPKKWDATYGARVGARASN